MLKNAKKAGTKKPTPVYGIAKLNEVVQEQIKRSNTLLDRLTDLDHALHRVNERLDEACANQMQLLKNMGYHARNLEALQETIKTIKKLQGRSLKPAPGEEAAPKDAPKVQDLPLQPPWAQPSVSGQRDYYAFSYTARGQVLSLLSTLNAVGCCTAPHCLKTDREIFAVVAAVVKATAPSLDNGFSIFYGAGRAYIIADRFERASNAVKDAEVYNSINSDEEFSVEEDGDDIGRL